MSAVDDTVRLGIGELYAAYADCIDDDRLEEWPDFFVDDCRYLISDRQSHEAGYQHGVIYCASRGMLIDRITAMRRVLMFEAHRYRHLVGPAHANFFAARIMHSGETVLFATGRYLDRIDIGRQPYRFIERLVVLDSPKIDTLIAIPL